MTTTNKFALALIGHIDDNYEHFAVWSKFQTDEAIDDFTDTIDREYSEREAEELTAAMHQLGTDDLFAIQVALGEAVEKYENE